MRKNWKQVFNRLNICTVAMTCCMFAGSPLYANAESAETEAVAQQEITVTGTVLDEIHKDPLIGATIRVKGVEGGTVTDIDGKFSIKVPYANATIVVSYIGYAPKEIPLKGQRTLTITLLEDTKALEEVVVVGYTKQRKETMVGSVSTITTKDLKQSPTANINNALAGRLPGLVATQFGGGEPGVDKSNIYIRGKATYGDQNPIVIVDGVERDMSYVSADEIETFTILKDASATAAYGIRGANGVIVITTKRGQAAEKASVSLKASVGVNMPVSFPEYLGSADYATLYNEAIYNDALRNGTDPALGNYFSQDAINRFRMAKGDNSDGLGYDTDYYDMIFKPAIQQDYNLSIRGGTDKARYYVLAGYYTQNGNYEYVERDKQNFTRYNFRTNVDINITKRLSARLDLGVQMTDRTAIGASASSLMKIASARAPYLPLFVENNSHPSNEIFIANNPDGLLYGDAINRRNIIGELMYTGKQRERNIKMTSSFALAMDLDFITPGLRFEGQFSYDANEGNWHKQVIGTYNDTGNYQSYPGYPMFSPSGVGGNWYMNPGHYYGAYSNVTKWEKPTTPGNDFSYNASESRTYYQAKLDYSRTFNEVHEVTGMLMFNRTLRRVNADIPYASQGYSGRFSYYYNKKYLAEFNFGYNGSENFAPGNRYGFFPAGSIGWVMSSEPWMEKTKSWLDFLKFRVSYGLTGSDYCAGQRFLYLAYYNVNADRYRSGSGWPEYGNGTAISNLANTNISWEKARKLNAGFDMNMFGNRLTMTVDGFYEYRFDIVTNLVGQKLGYPEYIGADASYVNAGIVKNRGVDFEIGWQDRIGKDFSYYIRPNFTFARNQIVYSAELPVGYSYNRETGKRMGEHYNYVFDHFVKDQAEADRLNAIRYQQWGTLIPGDCVYRDLNRDGIIDDNDKTAMGNPEFPEIQYGIPIGFQYKNFDFSMLWQGSALCDKQMTESTIYPFQVYETDGLGKVKAIHMQRWTPQTADTARMPALHTGNDNNNNRSDNSLYMFNSSYIRLKSVEIGYRLPQNWISKAKLEQVRFYLQGTNLLTFDGLDDLDVDPETGNGWGGAYPILKVFNFGVDITF